MGITNCLTVDGQTTATSDIPMGGFRITGLGNPLNPQDAVNLTTLQSAGFPSGALSMFAGATIPTGWLVCNGAAVSRTTYQALFIAIGTLYGSGNGSTTFNVPDLRGRAPIGVGAGTGLTNRTLASESGEETVILSTTTMPAHTHTDAGHIHSASDAGHTHTIPAQSSAGYAVGVSTFGFYPTGSTGTNTGYASITVSAGNANIQSTGGGVLTIICNLG